MESDGGQRTLGRIVVGATAAFLRQGLSIIRRVPVLPHRFVAVRPQERRHLGRAAIVVDFELLERVGRGGVAAWIRLRSRAHRGEAKAKSVVAENRALARGKRQLDLLAKQPK